MSNTPFTNRRNRPSLDAWALRECPGPVLWAEHDHDPVAGLDQVLIATTFAAAGMLIIDDDLRRPDRGDSRDERFKYATFAAGFWRLDRWIDPGHPWRLYSRVKMMPWRYERAVYERPAWFMAWQSGRVWPARPPAGWNRVP